ncbi:winged helix-turn-helix domain-containing protein [Nonomuraea sp. NBC_01738]|uniref:winged helix-turn-helix domain-containing protein n=1 Tax=Nonomuraea sp. NBC_01738 TaxID=2976003 RepID=UPI002E0E393D|nr:winged helix-turn-helix domain-containing protein [Nonomuraea sp. NBC_01738]
MEESFRITDPQVLKAVSHPLRVRLLGLLRAEGPATASQLGRVVGESSGSTSYHLRELAKYGFIEEDPSPDGRERRWRARHLYTSWDNAQMSATPEGRESLTIMRARQLEFLGRATEQFDPGAWDPAWVTAAGMTDLLGNLPPAGLKEFFDRTDALLAELEERYAGDPAAEQIHLFVAGYPRKPEAS